WDAAGCVQTVNVLDASNGTILDSQMLAAFDGGVYLVWDLQGHIQIQFIREAGPRAVFSGVFFDPVSEIADSTQPSAAQSLDAAMADASFPSLSWVDTSDTEAGFTIERASDEDGPFDPIATVGENVTTYSDIDALPGMTYFYRVRASGSSGDSDYSN